MDEAISKQKVIDKLDEALERITKNVSKESDAYHIVYGTVDITKCMIMTLPPIQPEIIHCKDCKHRDPEDKKCDCGHDIQWQLPRRDDWYCADAERREVTG